MSNAEQQSLEALAQITQRIEQGADHYGILGIAHDSTTAVIREVFFRYAKILHPDLPVFAKEEDKTAVTKAFQAISAANNTLSDEARRAEYDAALGAAGVIKGGGVEPDPNLAAIYMHRSKQVLQQRSWKQAEEGLRGAKALFGPAGNLECDTYLAWAIFNNTATPEELRAQESRELLDGVLSAEPGGTIEAQACYYLAIWCKLQDEVPSVRQHLQRCLKLYPGHIDAQRELRLFDRRRKSSQARKDKRRSTGKQRRSSRSQTPAAAATDTKPKKVPLKKKKNFLDWLMGK